MLHGLAKEPPCSQFVASLGRSDALIQQRIVHSHRLFFPGTAARHEKRITIPQSLPAVALTTTNGIKAPTITSPIIASSGTHAISGKIPHVSGRMTSTAYRM